MVNNLKTILFLVALILSAEKKLKTQKVMQAETDMIDITQYAYPKVSSTGDDIVIPIMGTSDMHGNGLTDIKDSIGKQPDTFNEGGSELINSFYKILKEEWNENLLWYGWGDIFQGGYE